MKLVFELQREDLQLEEKTQNIRNVSTKDVTELQKRNSNNQNLRFNIWSRSKRLKLMMQKNR